MGKSQMIKSTKTSLLAAALVSASSVLISCSGKMVLMKSDLGDVQKCEVSAQSEMLTGAWAAGREVDRCVEQWTKAGYKKIE